MTLTLDLPDFILARLGAGAGRAEEESLRTFICGLYREGRITAPEAMRTLGMDSRISFENLIAQHRTQRDWSEEEVAAELETIERINR